MLDLAEHFGKKPISLKEIAHRQSVSEKYLSNLASLLKVSGLVLSARGSAGGYVLARQPAEISILDIVKGLAGPVRLVGCLEQKKYCPRYPRCKCRVFWAELSQGIEKKLSCKTLEDLM